MIHALELGQLHQRNSSETVKKFGFRATESSRILSVPKGGGVVRDGWVHNKESYRERPAMTFTFKLSRRLARLRAIPLLALLFATVSCSGEDLNEPSTPLAADPTAVTIFPDSATVAVNGDTQFEAEPTATGEEMSASRWRWFRRHQPAKLAITPESTTLHTGAKQTFSASTASASGRALTTRLAWSATGGQIDQAGRYTAGNRAGKFAVIVKTASGLSDTAGVTITDGAQPPTAPVSKVVLTPASASVKSGGSVSFSAEGKAADGSSIAIDAEFSASGGSIGSSGKYTAPSGTGSYRVVAKDAASGKADTSIVSVSPDPGVPTLKGVLLTPSSATVKSGETAKFSATGLLSNGADTAIGMTYSATGGSVTSNGTYTAGSTAGTYRVIAKLSVGSFADTSTVTIPTTTPTTPPPPPSSAGCDAGDRVVNVSSAGELKSALSGAQAGDCITLASGNYSIGETIISRSGTSSNRITLSGPRSAVLSGVLVPRANYWTFKGFTVTGGLWGIYSDPGSWNVYDGVEIHHTQQEGIHLHGASQHNVIQNMYIHHTGTVKPAYGECIYLGSGADGKSPADNNQVLNNRLELCQAEGVDVKEGTSNNLVQGNTITNVGLGRSVGSDAGIAIRGSGAQVIDNVVTGTPRYSMQVWPEAGWGKNNVLRGNKMSGIGAGYYGIQVRDGYQSGTTVGCDNVVIGGAKIADVTCK